MVDWPGEELPADTVSFCAFIQAETASTPITVYATDFVNAVL